MATKKKAAAKKPAKKSTAKKGGAKKPTSKKKKQFPFAPPYVDEKKPAVNLSRPAGFLIQHKFFGKANP